MAKRSYPNGKVGCKMRTEAVVSQDTRAFSRGNMAKLPTGNLKSFNTRHELVKLAHRYNYEYGGRSTIRVWRSESLCQWSTCENRSVGIIDGLTACAEHGGS